MRYLFLLTLSVMFLSGCAVRTPQDVAKKLMPKEAFPPDLTDPAYTLLVLKWDKSWAGTYNEKGIPKFNKEIEKIVSELKIPAIAVTQEELASAKYSDVNKYRYQLYPSNFESGPEFGTKVMQLYYTDRKEKKTYPSTKVKMADYLYGIKCATAYYQ